MKIYRSLRAAILSTSIFGCLYLPAIAQNSTAATTAANGSECTASQPFYWEIGSSSGAPIVSGQVGGADYSRSTVVKLASASKWIFGTYAVEVSTGVPNIDLQDALNMQTGFNYNFNPVLCALTAKVKKCHTIRNNDTVTSGTIGSFFYGGGDGQYAATDLMGLGGKTKTTLANTIRNELNLGSSFSYQNVGLSGGMKSNTQDYAGFLQNLMSGDYYMSNLLDFNPVSTQPCPSGYSDCSPIGTIDMEYSLHHWIETHSSGTLPNGVAIAAGDGAYSSPGAHGFYPWITSDKSYYGIVTREGAAGSFNDSLACGQAIRAAFLN